MVDDYSNTRCYLCNCELKSNKLCECLFDERPSVSGQPATKLADSLAIIFGYELQADKMHSTLLCSNCKVRLLHFEELECKLQQARSEILGTFENTAKSAHINDLQQQCPPPAADANTAELNGTLTLEDLIEDIIYESSDEEKATTASAQPTPSYDCSTCTQTFPTKLQLSQHRRSSHAPETQFTCEYCSQNFARLEYLKVHRRTHTGARPYKCGLCDASFAQRSNARTHMHTIHLKEAKFACSVCGKHFKRRRLLNYHIKSVHTQLRDIKCEQCDATFSHPASYKKHLLSHAGVKPFSCEICGKHFSRQENRNVHRFLHSNKKPYACGVCNAGYMRRAQLVTHMEKSQHTGGEIVVNKPQFNMVKSANLDEPTLQAAACN